mmetsp:Transcript_41968/g.100895  ORF Transcript_41968/g.100895 Transcript_41968/m.100895 type:complete len:250 (+) Transcript_41968:593-1342(+)
MQRHEGSGLPPVHHPLRGTQVRPGLRRRPGGVQDRVREAAVRVALLQAQGLPEAGVRDDLRAAPRLRVRPGDRAGAPGWPSDHGHRHPQAQHRDLAGGRLDPVQHPVRHGHPDPHRHLLHGPHRGLPREAAAYGAGMRGACRVLLQHQRLGRVQQPVRQGHPDAGGALRGGQVPGGEAGLRGGVRGQGRGLQRVQGDHLRRQGLHRLGEVLLPRRVLLRGAGVPRREVRRHLLSGGLRRVLPHARLRVR